MSIFYPASINFFTFFTKNLKLARTRQDIPLLTRNRGWAELPCVKNRRVYISDGNAYFSRSGPRLVDSLEILAHALHPDLHPLPSPLPAAVKI